MESSFRLFTVRGIDIKMHITFPLILVWGALQFGFLSGQGWEGAVFGVLVTLLLFAIVVLHELGHSFVALQFGVPIHQIVLLPIGGVAQMERIPEQPGQEFLIAIAGPSVNILLAILFILLGYAAGFDVSLRSMARSLQNVGSLTPVAVFNYLFLSNLFIAVFNLLPAFPMDGGRVFRAILATRLDYARATSISVFIGQSLAWLLGLWGFLGGGFLPILIAIFIYIGAGQEGHMVQVRSVLNGLRVEQAYSRHAETLNPGSTLRDAIELTLHSFQSNFPVCDDKGQLLGIVTYRKLVEALNSRPPDTPIGDVMDSQVAPVEPGESLFVVQQRLSESQLEAVPVVDDGHFLGLITAQDINEVFLLASSRADILRASPATRA